MKNLRKTGAEYESLAAEYLKRRGFRIIRRNFYCRGGDIDLIALDGDSLVFVEVKYRRTDTFGNPLEAVNATKQKRICRAASYFCMRYGYGEQTPCRFDVVGICGNGEIAHVRNAFEYRV